LSELKPCVVAMEACGGAHHVARFCQSVGHEPRLMSPLYVRPYQPATLPKYAVTPVEWHGPTSIQPSSNYSSKYQGQNFGWLFWGT
jgi:hypothetical protein